MTKTPVMFQKNQYKTVGGVVPIGTYFYRGAEGWMDGSTEGRKDGRKDGEAKTKSLHFYTQRRGTITKQ